MDHLRLGENHFAKAGRNGLSPARSLEAPDIGFTSQRETWSVHLSQWHGHNVHEWQNRCQNFIGFTASLWMVDRPFVHH